MTKVAPASQAQSGPPRPMSSKDRSRAKIRLVAVAALLIAGAVAALAVVALPYNDDDQQATFPPAGETLSPDSLAGVRIGDTLKTVEKLWGPLPLDYHEGNSVTRAGDIVAAWGRNGHTDCYAEVVFRQRRAVSISVWPCSRLSTEYGDTINTPFSRVKEHSPNGTVIRQGGKVLGSGGTGQHPWLLACL